MGITHSIPARTTQRENTNSQADVSRSHGATSGACRDLDGGRDTVLFLSSRVRPLTVDSGG